MVSFAPCLPGDGWRLGLERPYDDGVPAHCKTNERSGPRCPNPIISKAYKIPFPDISMRYGKAVILRMEMLARRR